MLLRMPEPTQFYSLDKNINLKTFIRNKACLIIYPFIYLSIYLFIHVFIFIYFLIHSLQTNIIQYKRAESRVLAEVRGLRILPRRKRLLKYFKEL